MISTSKALEIAIDSIRLRNDLSEATKRSAMNKLESLDLSGYYIKWDEQSVIDALISFKDRNGRAPTTTDLAERGMPKGVTISSLFHMKPASFLRKLFPETSGGGRRKVNKFGFNTKEEWLRCFANQFTKHNINCCNQYNEVRDDGTPAWETIAKKCSVRNWSELMSAAGVSYYNQRKTSDSLQVCSSQDRYIEEIKRLNIQHEEHLKELYQLINMK